ncbi:amino acid aminotransferase [Basilea psittacipulmonis]|uniref:Aminotransferase n=1 Tax=Basilea psittacipulmonis DSM 24701 TaxID=1072685 RepID=A0A077DH41_9BURK|nr:amino acid aminotransferase [Basilea psittacipulmonis]AIL32742.1 aromatic amino acid aminotransferase [Basilea psittacipulmonis DSM 24701]
MSNIFESVPLAPSDPILGITEKFNADARPNKVNLGVGVYYDDHGKVPLLQAIRQAEETLLKENSPRTYLPIDGLKAYDLGAQKLLLGANSKIITEKRAVTFQSLGGTGALKVGADFLKTVTPDATVYVSNPTWANHHAIFANAGFKVDTYPYYNPQTYSVDFEALTQFFKQLAPRSIVVLHACCHNPTGAEMTHAQWEVLADIIKERELTPFLDIAYQGFGKGLDEDAYAVRLFAEKGISILVASSFSKSFSLYGERVGALTITTQTADDAVRVQSQVKCNIRSNYSNPPIHGAAMVAKVLNNPELFALWENELAQMRQRIHQTRVDLVAKLKALEVKRDFSFMVDQQGMFSFSGLTADQVARLADEFGIYAVKSGRICMAALNSQNIDYVAKAIASVEA